MPKNAKLRSPSELVAIARAAHVVGDSDLKRAAVAELKRRFAIDIRFGGRRKESGVADVR